jgi:type IV pilus assembly protein PilA
MIKRANNKKKKGFTLIELIIVLAVMAIIALIAIPNFSAVRENSKIKADKQSCETIERTILMLVSDETIEGNGTISFTPKTPLAEGDVTGIKKGNTSDTRTLEKIVEEALAEVKAPQGKVGTEKDDAKATKYTITIKDGSVEAVTATAE